MTRSRVATPILALPLVFAACGDPSEAPPTPSEPIPATAAADTSAQSERDPTLERGRAIFGIPSPHGAHPDNAVNDAKVALGRMLYYDTRLSKNHDVACDSCHELSEYGVDGDPTSTGHRGQRGDRNAPTVYNAAHHIAQFWDGRAANLEEQAKGSVLNPVEMAMPSEEAVLIVLRSIPGYRPLFEEAFPGEEDPITYDNMARAIGAFERGLLTRSRFDAFLEGDDDALRGEELAGMRTFIEIGCVTCHMGTPVGGTTFQKLGAVKPYPTEDLGRYNVTKADSERFVFKVPSLHNVAKTAPYFHDGSIASLGEAIRKMAEHQLGKTLTDEEARSIRTFLESLTGDLDPAYIARPELPESGPDTPPPAPA